jgi:hypothetical protein
MPSKYKKLIRDFCSREGIQVPGGFGRHTPGRYVVVRIDKVPHVLTATTWSKTSDVIYYVENFLVPELGDKLSTSIRLLDFQQGDELGYAGSSRLVKLGGFHPITDSPS